MLSVVCRLRCECIVTKLLKAGSHDFHGKVVKCLSFWHVKFDCENQGSPQLHVANVYVQHE